MIDAFVKLWEEKKDLVKEYFEEKHPANYKDIVKQVFKVLEDSDYSWPDSNKIHSIDDGNYQGTLVFVVPECGYQPGRYWAVKVSYGSCSGCDTLEGIRNYTDEVPTPEQVNDYMTLALHILQNIKEI